MSFVRSSGAQRAEALNLAPGATEGPWVSSETAGMTASPYATPESVIADAPGSGPAALYAVGRGQKAILWLVVLSLLPLVPLAVRVFVGPVFAALAYRIARHVYSPVAALAVALLCGLPLFGLFALGFLNARATRLLRGAGIRVGFMGADVSHLRSTAS